MRIGNAGLGLPMTDGGGLDGNLKTRLMTRDNVRVPVTDLKSETRNVHTEYTHLREVILPTAASLMHPSGGRCPGDDAQRRNVVEAAVATSAIRVALVADSD